MRAVLTKVEVSYTLQHVLKEGLYATYLTVRTFRDMHNTRPQVKEGGSPVADHSPHVVVFHGQCKTPCMKHLHSS